MSDPVNGALDSLIANIVKAPIDASNSPLAPDRGQEMLRIFEQAFPDQTFAVSVNGNTRTIESTGKKAPKFAEAVPQGYSPQLAQRGIEEMRTALEKETDDSKKLSLAIQLNTMVQTHKAYKFDEYRRRSEMENGIPDLLNSIERIRQAELSSPYNPGDGSMSAQRLSLYETLGVARTRAAQRVDDLMKNDPTFALAENMAKGTIAEIQARSVLDERTSRQEERDARTAAREAGIAAIDPNMVNNVSIMRRGRVPQNEDERKTIAAQMYDGKIKLSDTENRLAGANVDQLQYFYTTAQDPKDKMLSLKLLAEQEKMVTGDEKVAERNMKNFQAAFNVNLDDPSVPATVRQKWKQIKDEMLVNTTMGNKEKTVELNMRKSALQRELLAGIVLNDLQNVNGWTGVIASDETARALLRQREADPNNVKKPYDMPTFISDFLAYNDGRTLQDKSKSIRAMATSAISALPRSAVLPIPDSASFDLQVQAIMAKQMLNRSNVGPFINNPFRF